MTEGSRPAERSAAFPRPLTSLIGREDDLETISRLLWQHRLVTLIGSGGCGKTRLALEVASEMEHEFEGGGAFVDLAPIDAGDLVASVVAATLGVPETGSAPLTEMVTRALRDSNLLMVIDNCERVVDACAELVHALLTGCPRLVVLATSRTPIAVDGELTWRVPSLSLPPQQSIDPVDVLEASDAGRLLLERAQLQVANGVASSEGAQALVDICVKLDGIPLALEMAATRVRALGAEEVARGLKDRFRLLASGSRSVPPRQRTLEASIDWSYNLLGDADQVLLRRLAIFPAGFGVDAVETICSDDLLPAPEVRARLAELVDQSLVYTEVGNGRTRYRLLETVRHYALERLSESREGVELRNRHFDLLYEVISGLDTVEEGTALEKAVESLDPLVDDLRSGLEWSMRSGRVADGLRLAATLRPFWIFRNRNQEGRDWLDKLLQADDSSDLAARAAALLAGAHLCLYASTPMRQERMASEALQVARKLGHQPLVARSLLFTGWANVFLDPDQAGSLFSAARQAALDSSDEREFENASWGLGWMAATTGDLRAACQALDEGIASARPRGTLGLRYGLTMRGYVAILQAELAMAQEMLSEAASLFPEDADRFNADRVTTWLGVVAMYRGAYKAARQYLESAIASAAEVGNPPMFAPLHLGLLDRAMDVHEAARARIEEARPALSDLGSPRWFETQALVCLGDAAEVAGNGHGARSYWREAMSMAEISGNPLSKTVAVLGLARGAVGDRDEERARSLSRDALRSAVGAGYIIGAIDALEALALLPGPNQAQLLHAVEAERVRTGYVRFPVDRPAYHAALAGADGPTEDEDLAQEALDFDDAVDVALGDSGPARPQSGWRSLTPAEHRVALLVADGLTNPEVGERLFISRRTVQAHLSHTYAKLGVANRAELAAVVSRNEAE